MILVKCQKRFVDRCKVARNLEAYLCIEFLDTLLDFLSKLLLFNRCFGRRNRAFVDDWVLSCQCHVWEEQLSELGIAKLTLVLLEDVLQLEVGSDFLRSQL